MASRFWVGGTGTWDAADTTHWSATSGGGGGSSVPTSSDDVTFDSLSNATAYTVTISATANCLNFSMAAPLTGAVTWAGSSALNVFGNFALPGGTSGITRNYNGNITFAATSGTKTIDGNGIGLRGVIFNGVGGTFQLTNTLRFVQGSTFTLTNGTFDANSQTVSFESAAQSDSITGAFTGSSSFYNLTRIGGADTTSLFNINSSIAVTNTFTVTGNSAINRVYIKNNTVGTNSTITAATVTVTNADFRDITGAGAGSWNLSGTISGDAGGNSGITFTTAATQTWSGTSGGNWSANAWSGRVPLPQDNVVINAAFSGGQTITANMPRLGKSIDFTGATGTPTFTTSTIASIFGSLTLISGMVLTGSTQGYTFEGRSSYTLTNAGNSWAKIITFGAPGGTYTLQDDFTSSTQFVVQSGTTFTSIDKNLTASLFSLQSPSIVNMGSGTWTSTGTSGGTWSAIINANTSTLKYNDTSNTNIAFTYNNGTVFYNVWFSRGASTGNITISNTGTFNDFKDDGTAAHSLIWQATIVFTFTTFTVSGTVGNLITLDSTSAGFTYSLVKSGGGVISSDYLNIQHSVATPANTWYAGTHSTNNQGVAAAGSGWIFTAAPEPSMGYLRQNKIRPRMFGPGNAR